MTAKNFINSVVALCSAGMTNVAIGASAYISHGKLEDELPPLIIGSLAGVFLFLLVNWLFKPRSNKSSKANKKRR